MKSAKSEKHANLNKQFQKLKIKQEKKQKFQVILEEIETLNSLYESDECNRFFSLDNSTK